VLETVTCRNLVDFACRMSIRRAARVSHGATHTTGLAIPQARIRFQIAPGTGTGLGIADVPYEIYSGTARVSSGNTDPNGEISIPVQLIQAGNCSIRAFGTEYPVSMVNAWEDVTTEMGQQQRLNNLGYVTGFLFDLNYDLDSTASRGFQAVNAFQWDADLRVDGNCGPATRRHLRRANGGI